MKHFLLLMPSSALLLLMSGCGAGTPATGQVTGRVLLGDQPVRSGTITFVDALQKETPTAISPEGKYRVSRLAVGPARITLLRHASTPFSKEPPDPARYATYEVRRGEQEHDLVFEP